MSPESRRSIILGAMLAGCAFDWLPPALLAAFVGPLPTLVFVVWSATVAIGAFLIVSVNGLDRPRR